MVKIERESMRESVRDPGTEPGHRTAGSERNQLSEPVSLARCSPGARAVCEHRAAWGAPGGMTGPAALL